MELVEFPGDCIPHTGAASDGLLFLSPNDCSTADSVYTKENIEKNIGW
jgi:hypothetical protein